MNTTNSIDEAIIMNDAEINLSSNSRTADKFVVRLPKGMRQLIADVAKNYHRSMNSEIVARLECSLRTEPCLGSQDEENALDGISNEDNITVDISKQEFAVIERIRSLDAQNKEALTTLLSNLNTQIIANENR